jgi:hypothetical protein
MELTRPKKKEKKRRTEVRLSNYFRLYDATELVTAAAEETKSTKSAKKRSGWLRN